MKQLLIFIIIINLSACGYLYNHDQDKTYIRIVDSKGKPKKVKTFTPQLNIQYLTDQKRDQSYEESNYQINSQTSNSVIADQNIPAINKIKNNPINNNLLNSDQSPLRSSKTSNIAQEKPESAAIIYDLNNDRINKKDSVIAKIEQKKSVKKERTKKKIKRGDLLIQIASFSNKMKAIKAQKQKKLINSRVLSVKIGKKTYHKLVIGPFKNKKDGNKKLQNLKKSGYKDAFYYKFK
ncbi:SPOR domain-containing protein [Rickettsiales bacterium]|nr:SPOR domain-containing protein [Rickettsiales bacterium]